MARPEDFFPHGAESKGTVEASAAVFEIL